MTLGPFPWRMDCERKQRFCLPALGPRGLQLISDGPRAARGAIRTLRVINEDPVELLRVR